MRVRGPNKIGRDYEKFSPPLPKRFSPFGLVRNLMLMTTSTLLVVGLLAVIGFWRSGPRFIEALKMMITSSAPIQRADVRSIVVQQVQGASELTTAIMTMEVVVPTVSDRTLAGYVIGKTNLLYIAHGEVRAGIDLSQLTEADVSTSGAEGAETVVIQLPAPQLLDSKIDVTRSQVYDYDRGFLGLGPDKAPQLQEMAQTKALAKIEQAACEQDILSTASERAEWVVKQLLDGIGYGNVVVEVKAPESCLTSGELLEQPPDNGG